jgi:hypothetical protein
MHNPPQLEHALYGSQGAGGYRFLASSPGFNEAWQAEAERLCTGFGERPAGVACPRAVFARPFAGNHVAVVQAADQGQDDQGRPGALSFYIVVLPAHLYEYLGGDPFYLAEQLPPPWTARGVLSPLSFTEPPPPRTTTGVVELLKLPTSATLFGGVQALLDGGQLAFERPAPDEPLVRGLWALLPYSSRQELWPASFAFGNALEFDAVVVPRLDPAQFPGYILEEHAGDYPEGQYELALQRAAESGNQEELDTLFTRRSYRQTRRLALILLTALFCMGVLALVFKNPARLKREKPEPRRQETPDGFDALKKANYPRLSAQERDELTLRLRELTTMMDTPVPANVPGSIAILGLSAAPGAALNTSALVGLGWNWLTPAEDLLDALDVDPNLGTPDMDRKGREIKPLKPVELKLRALLFKHGVKSFDDSGKSAPELVDDLQTQLVKEGRKKKRRER